MRVGGLWVVLVICMGCALPGASAGLAFRTAPALSYMLGLHGPSAGEDARRLGLSAVYLVVGSADANDLEAIRATARRARSAGVQVVVELPSEGPLEETVSSSNTRYVNAVVERIQAAVRALKDEPAITVWATGDMLESRIRYTAEAFQRYLRGVYPDIGALNASWGTRLAGWGEISVVGALALDDEMPFGVGRPSVDCADFMRQEFHDILALWGRAVRDVDPSRPLMTGRISLYRHLSAIPDEYDIVQVWAPVGALEADSLGGNTHAVEMARRGGRFAVIPVFTFPLPPDPLYAENALARWIGTAALCGAAGYGLDNAARIQEIRPPTEVLARLEGIIGAFPPSLLGVQPRGSAAILWEPYAEGFSVGSQKVPVYGFIQGLGSGESAALIGEFRRGTVFGTVDVLHPADLHRSLLDGYSVIFAPMALRLPPTAIIALQSYMDRGGVLVADLGLGMYETGRWDALPSEARTWTGVEGFAGISGRAGYLTFDRAQTLLPSVHPGARTRGAGPAAGRPHQITRFSSAGGRAYAVQGPVASAYITGDTTPMAVLTVEQDKQQRLAWAGLLARTRGFGACLYATLPLWANWGADDPVFLGFHYDLISRRSAYRLLGAAFLPGTVQIAALPDDAVRLFNSGGRTTADVLCLRADDRAYEGGFARFSARSRLDTGRRSGYAQVTCELRPWELRTLKALPVRIQPYAGEALARVERYGPEGIVLVLAGDQATLKAGRDGILAIAPGTETQTRVTISTGVYPTPAGSQHHVEVTWPDGRVESKVYRALTGDQFRFDVTAALARIAIRPATAP